MPRKGRRDCRKSETKKNPMNVRVEALQKSIRKSKKEAATTAAPAEPSSLTPTAAAFLSQMRADVAAEIATTRENAGKSTGE